MFATLTEIIRGIPTQHCPVCIPTTPVATTWRWCPTCRESWHDPNPAESA